MSTQPFPTLRRLTATLVPLLLVGALSTACGGEAEPEEQPGAQTGTASEEPSGEPSAGSSTEPSESPEADAPDAEVTLEEGAYSPLGERVEVAVGEPVLISVTADAPGSLHVHSTPEQEIVFEAGTSEHELTLDRPGVVEVESHEPAPALVILQLEAR